MSDEVIRAENLGKKYTIGHQAENGRYVALRDVLMQNARGLWQKTKDLAQGKLTYLSLMSRAEAKGRVEELTREGLGALLPLGEKADALRLLVRELIERDS